jgi:hypothetical protein
MNGLCNVTTLAVGYEAIELWWMLDVIKYENDGKGHIKLPDMKKEV